MSKNIIKSAEILCVGTELLLGDIVNTNATFLGIFASRYATGYAISKHITVTIKLTSMLINSVLILVVSVKKSTTLPKLNAPVLSVNA